MCSDGLLRAQQHVQCQIPDTTVVKESRMLWCIRTDHGTRRLPLEANEAPSIDENPQLVLQNE